MYKLLQGLVLEKMHDEGISLREASRQMGMPHSTLFRVTRGKTVDFNTVETVCDWLGVEVRSLLGSGVDDDLSAKIRLVMQREPRFAEVMAKAVDLIEKGKADPGFLKEVANYAAFRLGID